MAAFDAVREAGLWGIEFDLRWTRDLQPVVIHDDNARRVFGLDLVIADVSLAELRARLEQVPTLQEVVDRFGGNTHMMIELKSDSLGQAQGKRLRLQQILGPLTATVDFHMLALELDLFEVVDFVGSSACIPVAELNIAALSRATLDGDYAGISAQYLLLTGRMIERHRQRGQQAGTGFAASRYCLYRELNRGVQWIFTNHALRLAAIRRKLLAGSE